MSRFLPQGRPSPSQIVPGQAVAVGLVMVPLVGSSSPCSLVRVTADSGNSVSIRFGTAAELTLDLGETVPPGDTSIWRVFTDLNDAYVEADSESQSCSYAYLL